MSTEFWIFISGFILLVIFIILFVIYNLYEPNTAETPDFEEMKNQYNIKSPWSKSIPLEETCKLYTFTSRSPYSTANIKLSELNYCQELGICSIMEGQSCYSSDQIFAKKYKHTCTGNNLVSISNGKCLTQNGELVNEGEEEEFYIDCKYIGDAHKKCLGILSLLSFNLKPGFIGTTCLQSPFFNSDGKIFNFDGFVTQQYCDVRNAYNGIPLQLFQVIRANYSKTGFQINDSGQYIKIVHRPSGYVLEPLSMNIFFSKITFKEDKGYNWFLTTYYEEDDPVKKIKYIIPSQLIYIEDFSLFPKNTSPENIKNYMFTYKPSSIHTLSSGGTLIVGSELYMDTFFMYTKNLNLYESNSIKVTPETDQVKYTLNSTEFVNYPFLPFYL